MGARWRVGQTAQDSATTARGWHEDWCTRAGEPDGARWWRGGTTGRGDGTRRCGEGTAQVGTGAG